MHPKNIAKKYLRKEHGAFAFEDIHAFQRSVDGWIVEGFLNNPTLGWRYFVIYVDDGRVSFCSVHSV